MFFTKASFVFTVLMLMVSMCTETAFARPSSPRRYINVDPGHPGLDKKISPQITDLLKYAKVKVSFGNSTGTPYLFVRSSCDKPCVPINATEGTLYSSGLLPSNESTTYSFQLDSIERDSPFCYYLATNGTAQDTMCSSGMVGIIFPTDKIDYNFFSEFKEKATKSNETKVPERIDTNINGEQISSKTGGGFSGGAIVGIVLGSLFGMVFLAFVVSCIIYPS